MLGLCVGGCLPADANQLQVREYRPLARVRWEQLFQRLPCSIGGRSNLKRRYVLREPWSAIEFAGNILDGMPRPFSRTRKELTPSTSADEAELVSVPCLPQMRWSPLNE